MQESCQSEPKPSDTPIYECRSQTATIAESKFTKISIEQSAEDS